MSDISKMDWDTIDRRVNDIQQRRPYPTKSMAFLSIVMEQHFPGIEEHLPELITDGSDDRGVDGIYIREGEDVAEIFIFQSKYQDKFVSRQNRPKTINDNEVLKISQFLKELFNKSPILAKCGNFHLRENVKRIWELHESGVMFRYKVIFCSNGGGFAPTAEDIIKTISDEHQRVIFEFYGPSKVISAMHLEGRKPENGRLRVRKTEIFEHSDGNVRGVIASVHAPSFIELIANEDGRDVKGHLFDDNLRTYLSEKGGYNQSIINTAASRDNYLFWYLNNGVTITCKKFDYNPSHDNPVLTFDDFQIVNGAQTSYSLFEVAKDNPDALNKVFLIVRIYATDRTDIAERVAIATNSQARIQGRDIYSNAPILKKLELALKEHGYFFERKKGMHADKPQEKCIDARKLGQIILAFYLHEPDKAKTSSDSIFDKRFEQIFHDKFDVKNLIRVFELFRIIERLRDNYQPQHSRSDESGNEHRYLIYGQWFVLFTCKLLLGNEMIIPEGEEAEKIVDEAIHLVASTDYSQESAHYLLFRSAETKKPIVEIVRSHKNNKQLHLFDRSNEH